MTFQRARSEEQREVRRQAILDAAAAMLRQLTVAELSLNELARRVGLAKSNVLRYFESREAVLLELLDTSLAAWIADLREGLARFDPTALTGARVEAVAGLLSSTLAQRPVLCDLISAQAAVLEHNVSPAVAARSKRSAVDKATEVGRLVRGVIPELDDAATEFAGIAAMACGAVWSHTQPSAALLQAYRADPDLAALRLHFEPALKEVLAVLLTGLLAGRGRAEPRSGW